MSLTDLSLLLLGALLEIAAAVAIVIGPEVVDCLIALTSREGWPGER